MSGSLVPALRAETLKLRRSLALWLAFIAPVTVVFLQTTMVLHQGSKMVPDDASIWSFLLGPSASLWSLLMLPLFVALETALTAGLEHSGDNWKHILALSVPRRSIYLAKLISSIAIIALAHLILAAAIVIAGSLVRLIQPQLGMAAALPWDRLWRYTALPFAGSLLIIVIHLWIAVRWRNFAVAMGVGIALTVCGVLVVNSRWAGYYPWTLPAILVNTFRNGNIAWPLMLYGLGVASVAAIFSTREFVRRDF